MSIFDSILSAIDNPEQQGSKEDIFNAVGQVQQLSQNYNINSDTLASAISVVGKYVQGSLQQQREQGGEQQVNEIVNQISQAPTDTNLDAPEQNPNLGLLFNSGIVQEIIQQVCQRTGLPDGIVKQILPSLVNSVVRMLQTGNFQNNELINNPVAKMFLDSDKDGDVDLGDAFKLASRYLGM